MNIYSAEFLKSSARLDQCPKLGMPEYAFIGRSNVGKSSLINMLTQRKGLAKTSSMPGKTVLISHFTVNAGKNPWSIVDLPGYGYAKRSKKESDKLQQMISSYILGREDMTLLFLLLDIRHEPQKIDLQFIEWLGENEVPFALVFTKADKLSRGAATANLERYLDTLKEQWEELPPYFLTSSSNRQGREELLEYIDEVNESLKS